MSFRRLQLSRATVGKRYPDGSYEVTIGDSLAGSLSEKDGLWTVTAVDLPNVEKFSVNGQCIRQLITALEMHLINASAPEHCYNIISEDMNGDMHDWLVGQVRNKRGAQVIAATLFGENDIVLEALVRKVVQHVNERLVFK